MSRTGTMGVWKKREKHSPYVTFDVREETSFLQWIPSHITWKIGSQDDRNDNLS
jgi:hypothetical protein